jgi:hypothetical protein
MMLEYEFRVEVLSDCVRGGCGICFGGEERGVVDCDK